MEWISVKDSKPEDDYIVLVHVTSPHGSPQTYGKHKYGNFLATYRKGYGKKRRWIPCDGPGFKFCKVTHWMPLPDEPK